MIWRREHPVVSKSDCTAYHDATVEFDAICDLMKLFKCPSPLSPKIIKSNYMAAAIGWRQHEFFRDTLGEGPDLTAESLVLGTPNGLIVMTLQSSPEDCQIVVSGTNGTRWRAFDIVTHIDILHQHGKEFICAIGLDSDKIPLLKVFSLQGELLKAIVITYQDQVNSVTAFCATRDLTVIGLNNGIVLIYQGQLLHKFMVKRLRLNDSLTAVKVTQNGIIYLITAVAVMAYSPQLKLMFQDVSGDSRSNCADLFDEQLAICRDDAVYLYNEDGRGACFVLDGSHVLQAVEHRQYVALVCATKQ